jgi:uncharacterized protein YkwD
MRSHLARLALVAGLLGSALVAPLPARAQLTAWPCTVSDSLNDSPVVINAMFDEINRFRAARGAAPLTLSPVLTHAALWKSVDRAHGGPNEHEDLSPFRTWDQRLADCGYPADAVGGEAFGTVTGVFPLAGEIAGVIEVWRLSPIHNAILSDPNLTMVGLARVKSPTSDVWMWTATFGYPLPTAGTAQPDP